MIRPNKPLPEEERAAAALRAAGIAVSNIGEGHPQNPLSQQWGVFHGSHGGHGRRLRMAMERSLKCCNIGRFWRNDSGKGEFTRTFFQRVARKHLGGPLKLPASWQRAKN